MPKIYEQLVTVRGQDVDQLAIYAQNYLDAESRYVVDALASEGLFQSADDDVLALWDSHCRNRGLLEIDGEHWFPRAEIAFPDVGSDAASALPAPPPISAEAIAEIASATADRLVAGLAPLIAELKPPSGDVVVERDQKGVVTGVRRRRATD